MPRPGSRISISSAIQTRPDRRISSTPPPTGRPTASPTPSTTRCSATCCDGMASMTSSSSMPRAARSSTRSSRRSTSPRRSRTAHSPRRASGRCFARPPPPAAGMSSTLVSSAPISPPTKSQPDSSRRRSSRGGRWLASSPSSCRSTGSTRWSVRRSAWALPARPTPSGPTSCFVPTPGSSIGSGQRRRSVIRSTRSTPHR